MAGAPIFHDRSSQLDAADPWRILSRHAEARGSRTLGGMPAPAASVVFPDAGAPTRPAQCPTDRRLDRLADPHLRILPLVSRSATPRQLPLARARTALADDLLRRPGNF